MKIHIRSLKVQYGSNCIIPDTTFLKKGGNLYQVPEETTYKAIIK